MSGYDWSTDNLLRQLHDGALHEVLQNDASLPPFSEHIAQMCLDRGEARGRVIRRAGIERGYGYQLFNGTRKPSRDKVIQLAFGFALDAEQTQRLLKAAQQSQLVPQIKRDAAILYGIMHGLDINEVQKLLERFSMPTLGG
ncbi:MAG TPA: XRE family transcriptional regulator [Clostridia bacterium]|nr:XRE family transcriptional regulator [Clostridia bacterium]